MAEFLQKMFFVAYVEVWTVDICFSMNHRQMNSFVYEYELNYQPE